MKQLLDFIISLIALLILSPLLVLLSILVAINFGFPIFFTQIRPGLNGKPFKIIKFRTMTNERDSNGNLLPNEKRITKFGAFMRSTSLDELPELLNVLKGEMSLVGPRPLLMEYLSLYNENQKIRNLVKPGITGWAQINGRNAITWEQKFELDVWYVENQSLFFDIKILILSILKVIKREGISHPNNVAMPRFKGTKSRMDKHE